MFVRKSHFQQPWCTQHLAHINKMLTLAVLGDNPDPDIEKQITLWHRTRQVEYPWCMEYCPPEDPILDIGSNHQFSCALLGMGHEVCLHSLPIETETFRHVSAFVDPAITFDACFRKYSRKATAVVGWLDTAPLPDEHFQTVYCISVIEHVHGEDDVDELMRGMWRVLKPGGRLCITADWFVKFAVDDGMEGTVFNFDLGRWITSLGGKVVTPSKEIPWSPDFDTSLWKDRDLLTIDWHQLLAVYGVVIEKPATVK